MAFHPPLAAFVSIDSRQNALDEVGLEPQHATSMGGLRLQGTTAVGARKVARVVNLHCEALNLAELDMISSNYVIP